MSAPDEDASEALMILMWLALAGAQELRLELRGPTVVEGRVSFALRTTESFHTRPRTLTAVLEGPGDLRQERSMPLTLFPVEPQPGCLPVNDPAMDCPPYAGPYRFEGMDLDLDGDGSRDDDVLAAAGAYTLTVTLEGYPVAPLPFEVEEVPWPVPDLTSHVLTPSYRAWSHRDRPTSRRPEPPLLARACWVDTDKRDLCVGVMTRVSAARLAELKAFHQGGNKAPEPVRMGGQTVLERGRHLRWYSRGRVIDVTWQGERRAYETAAIKEVLKALPAD